MIRIVICCSGGFSSSALAQHLENEVQEKNLDASFVFRPFIAMKDYEEEWDIAMLCPHLQSEARAIGKMGFGKPMYYIPPRMYGLMNAECFMEDAEDIVNLWNAQETHDSDIIGFPDEPMPLRIRRMTSHRRWIDAQNAGK